MFSKPDKSILALPNSIIITGCNGLVFDGCLEIRINTIVQLIDYLRSLLESPPDLKVDNLIIADISRFYWDLKFHNTLYLINTLPPILRNIQQKYGFNVIIGSWDLSFDRGYGNTTLINDVNNVNDVSYLGTKYFDQIDEIFYIHHDIIKLT